MGNNNKMKIVPGAQKQPAQLTAEQQMAAISRGFTQQFQSIAQGALFNLLHGLASGEKEINAAQVVEVSLNIAAEFMEKAGPAVDAAFAKVMNKAQEEKTKEEK